MDIKMKNIIPFSLFEMSKVDYEQPKEELKLYL